MTVQTNNNSIAYVGNGSTAHFDYDFLILDAGHLEVYFGDVLQTSGYVVSGVSSQTGGTVAFAVAPPNGIAITLTRSVPFLQLTDYQPYDAFPAESHERALDLLTMMVQQLKDASDRSMQYPVGGNKWDAKGNEIINVADGGADTSAASVGLVKDLITQLAGPDSAAQLRDELSQPDGYTMVGGVASQSDVDLLKSKSVDTITALRLVSPSAVGEVVYVRSSTVTPVGVYGYFGGGHFASYDNVQANIDDGGVFVSSPHPALDWQRINFTEYDMRFWGVITDLPSFDNAAAITKATDFAKARKVLLHAPSGNIYTSEMVPIYDNMGITGQGAAEQTVFYKTTNNAFPYKNGATTAFTVDALVGFVPKKSVAGGSMVDSETHTARPHLSKCMFRRSGLTDANYAATRPAVGMFLGSIAGGLISDVVVEGGHTAFQGWTCYLLTIERLFGNNIPGKGFTGFGLQAFTAAPVGYKTAGTSLDMRVVGVRGYQVGFSMIGQQYTSMTCCTVEECEPMVGETNAIAFQFINPYSITMGACATELVKGTQISVTNAPPVSYKSSLIVQNYIAIGQRNPQVAGTKFIEIDNGAAGTLNVTFIGGDLTMDTGLANLVGGTVSGLGAKAIKIGAGGLSLTAASGGVFTDLA